MLPNHAPLMVAERFKVLEALFPGRIDLGLGRAPGTDQITSYALRARQDQRQGDDFLERFQELLLLERGGYPEGHPFRKVRAVPSDVALPPIWLLGSSGYSAELAASLGLGFAFAHHFADYDAASAMLSYRDHFKPSVLSAPYAILGTAVIAAIAFAYAPYRITEASSGSHVTLERNPHWWGKPPAFRRIVVRAIENTAALESNLLSGSVDYLAGELGLSLDQAKEIAERLSSGAAKLEFEAVAD